MNSIKNGDQEFHGLMIQILRIFTALYLSNSLSHHVKIYMILCVDYVLTKENYTGATYLHGGRPLLEDLNVIPPISICVTIIFLMFGVTDWTTTLYGVVFPIKMRQRKFYKKILNK